jgi:hypothetical protein
MALIATYTNADDLALGLKALDLAKIPYTVSQAVADGLDVAEVGVADNRFDEACGVIEKHEESLLIEKRKGHRLSCPSCGDELQQCEDVDFSGSVTGITSVLKCAGCGRLIPR